jgi:hypothetical protein
MPRSASGKAAGAFAVHEAGHATVGRLLGVRSGLATLCDRDGKARSYSSTDGGSSRSIIVSLAGGLAELELLCTDSGGCADDNRDIDEALARHRDPDLMRRELIDRCRTLVRRNAGTIALVALHLMAKAELSGAEIDELMRC